VLIAQFLYETVFIFTIIAMIIQGCKETALEKG
jgi:hypothetical protein